MTRDELIAKLTAEAHRVGETYVFKLAPQSAPPAQVSLSSSTKAGGA